MHRRLFTAVSLTALLATAAHPLLVLGQDKVEGVVVNTNLTACSFKPGGCAGHLVLETQQSGKPTQTTIQVPLGTQIKKGGEQTYLPTLQDQAVTVLLTTKKGEKVAQSIDVVGKR